MVKLSSTITNPPPTSTLASNWNGGIVPKESCFIATVTKRLNNMINIQCEGYNLCTREKTGYLWTGWVPEDEIEILEEI